VTRAASVGGLLDELETDLLGRRALAFDAHARRLAWAPEDPDASCWRCAESVGAHECDGDGCAACRSHALAWDQAIRLGAYDEAPIRDAIVGLKYNAWRRTGVELGAALGRRLAPSLDAVGADRKGVLLVPVPMPWRRRLGRGVDHTQVLARAAAETGGFRVARLLHARNHPPQVGLSATDRTRNTRHAFRLRGSSRWRSRCLLGVRVLIVVDDVKTTGSTMGHACTALRAGLGWCGALWCGWAGVSTPRTRRAEGREMGKKFEAVV